MIRETVAKVLHVHVNESTSIEALIDNIVGVVKRAEQRKRQVRWSASAKFKEN